MTSLQFLVLQYLRASKETGKPYTSIEVSKVSLKALGAKGWIERGHGYTGWHRYAITPEGEEALKRFAAPDRRYKYGSTESMLSAAVNDG